MRSLLAGGLLGLGNIAVACAAPSWSVEAYVGNAYNFRSNLRVEQDGGYSRSVSADYRSRGFEVPLYYAVRASRWEGDRAWEASLIHHKLYLANPPPGVADLSVSHGMNLLTLNRAWRRGDWLLRAGAGPVVTHAEATINATRYDGPYKLSGAVALVGAGRRFYFGKPLFLSLEALATAAYVAPQLEGSPGARIKASNFALHGLAGIGYDF